MDLRSIRNWYYLLLHGPYNRGIQQHWEAKRWFVLHWYHHSSLHVCGNKCTFNANCKRLDVGSRFHIYGNDRIMVYYNDLAVYQFHPNNAEFFLNEYSRYA